jgi:hypothetical protein
VRRDRYVWFETCGCEHCKGRAAVCEVGFSWLDRRSPNHALQHAQEDFRYFERLPAVVQAALCDADVNVCAWCAETLIGQYGAPETARLIGDVRFISATRAVAPLDGWR